MKHFFLFLGIYFASIFAIFAQPLIIGHEFFGGTKLSHPDTLISSYHNEDNYCRNSNFIFDVDLDGEPDIDFNLKCSYGGGYRQEYMTIRAFNKFHLHVDTSFYWPAEYIVNQEVYDTLKKYIIPFRYYEGDTINKWQLPTTQESTYFYRYSSGLFMGLISVTSHNMKVFVGDTCYFALTKEGTIDESYFLKIHVDNSTDMKVLGYWSEFQPEEEEEEEEEEEGIPDYNIKAYPNPIINSLTLDYNHEIYPMLTMKVYNMMGNLAGDNLAGEKIDISWLNSGIYLIEFWNGSNKIESKRFIKF